VSEDDPRFALRDAGRADYPVGLPSEPDTHAGRLEWMLWQQREKHNAALARAWAEGFDRGDMYGQSRSTVANRRLLRNPYRKD